MNVWNNKLDKHIELLLQRYPMLDAVREDIVNA